MINNDVKKTVLRMIPYGLYILTSHGANDQLAAAAVNWVTQASFKPPLLAVAVKADSFAHTLIQESGVFALNVLGKDQSGTAFTFFKPTVRDGMTLSGEPFHSGETGSPILDHASAFVECRVSGSLALGDHTLFMGEVVAVGLNKPPQGRPDDSILALRDLGPNIFYGG
jgi:flavin reductase (DIM6/NTAB) family NADH-FMN oxidoreductase RutF